LRVGGLSSLLTPASKKEKSMALGKESPGIGKTPDAHSKKKNQNLTGWLVEEKTFLTL